MTSQCSEIGQLLGAFQDGELEPGEMREVARHLAQCGSCEAELSQHAALAQRLREAVTVPQLEGFADSVMMRIAQLAPPLHVRLRRRFELAREQITTALALGAAGLATAAITAVALTPYFSRLAPGVELARNTPAAISSQAETLPAIANSRAIISSLESHARSVAVWSEPQNETTVIWIPDQP